MTVKAKIGNLVLESDTISEEFENLILKLAKLQSQPEQVPTTEATTKTTQASTTTQTSAVSIDEPLPKTEDIINYILNKIPIEYHTVELQEKFLGRRIRYRDNPVLYGAFDRIIRSAHKQIEEKYGGKWRNDKRISIGGRTHVTVYQFEQPNGDNEVPVPDAPDKPLAQKWDLNKFRKIEPDTTEDTTTA